MKIIIEFDGVKREINGDFSICGSGRDLKLLMQMLRDKIGDDGGSFGYGWVQIREPLTTATNTAPIGWKDAP